MVTIKSVYLSSVPLQELRESIQRSIDTRVTVPIEVENGDTLHAAFTGYLENNLQAAGTTTNEDFILVTFPPKEREAMSRPVIVVG